MGWSYSQQAGKTMEKIEAACARSREPHGHKSSNRYYVSGKAYFYEVTRRDQADGGIAGEICLVLEEDPEGNGMARSVGGFCIDGKGHVVRGPKLFKLAE